MKLFRRFKLLNKRAKLLSFSEKDPGSFEDFKTNQLKRNGHLYASNQNERLLSEYLNWVDFNKKFFNLCKTHETVSIINNYYSDCIILSKNWQGEVTDHQDLILRPYTKRINYFDIKGEYFVEISSAAKMLTNTGTHPVLNSQGNFRVTFQKDGNALMMLLSGGRWETTTEATFELLD